jgi:glycosyltransferase involved in cell wall biosynthesis
MDISVIIPCYNNLDVLKVVLQQWKNVDYNDYEVIVVDDGSPPDSGIKEYVESLGYRYFYNDTGDKFSAASARNIGVWHAKADRLLFSDSDMIPHTNYIRAHLEKAKSDNMTAGIRHMLYGDQEYVISSFKGLKELEFTDDVIVHTDSGVNVLKFETDKRIGGDFLKLEAGDMMPWLSVPSCNFTVSKSCVVGVGGYDESYDGSWGAEEQDLQYRMWLRYKLSVAPVDSIGYHVPHKSRYTTNDNQVKFSNVMQGNVYMNPKVPRSWV